MLSIRMRSGEPFVQTPCGPGIARFTDATSNSGSGEADWPKATHAARIPRTSFVVTHFILTGPRSGYRRDPKRLRTFVSIVPPGGSGIVGQSFECAAGS